MKVSTPMNTAIEPSIMKNHLQGYRPVFSRVRVTETPYAMRPLKAPEIVAAA
jgi:hypothetical protein